MLDLCGSDPGPAADRVMVSVPANCNASVTCWLVTNWCSMDLKGLGHAILGNFV